MNTNLKTVRQLLEARLKEATQRDGSLESIRIQPVADPVDMTLHAAEREIAMHGLDRRAALVRQLRSAIDRIADGTYGICRECEEEIAPNRLRAIPWAELCIECHEAADRSIRGKRGAITHTDYYGEAA
jgi:DnaK suppressor protein